MMKNDEKKCHLKNDKVGHVLLYHFFKWWKSYSNCVSWEEKTYSTACAETRMTGSSFCCTYICVYLKERCLLVSNHAYLFVLVMSSWISPTKNLIKVLWCHAKEFLYSNLSSNLSSCTSIWYKHRLILFPSQGFTHTDVFLFFLFFFNK